MTRIRSESTNNKTALGTGVEVAGRRERRKRDTTKKRSRQQPRCCQQHSYSRNLYDAERHRLSSDRYRSPDESAGAAWAKGGRLRGCCHDDKHQRHRGGCFCYLHDSFVRLTLAHSNCRRRLARSERLKPCNFATPMTIFMYTMRERSSRRSENRHTHLFIFEETIQPRIYSPPTNIRGKNNPRRVLRYQANKRRLVK